jgi:predicted lipid-binding transport protein (Tim44 family)
MRAMRAASTEPLSAVCEANQVANPHPNQGCWEALCGSFLCVSMRAMRAASTEPLSAVCEANQVANPHPNQGCWEALCELS